MLRLIGWFTLNKVEKAAGGGMSRTSGISSEETGGECEVVAACFMHFFGCSTWDVLVFESPFFNVSFWLLLGEVLTGALSSFLAKVGFVALGGRGAFFFLLPRVSVPLSPTTRRLLHHRLRGGNLTWRELEACHCSLRPTTWRCSGAQSWIRVLGLTHSQRGAWSLVAEQSLR